MISGAERGSTSEANQIVGSQIKALQAEVEASISGYAVIVEWGRTPEEAAAAGPEVNSLRGMICVVPEGTSDDELSDLGRSLRSDFAAYDNLNIQVFDNGDAANAYSQTNSTDKGGPVLHISRFKASGEDTVTIFRNGQAKPVSLD